MSTFRALTDGRVETRRRAPGPLPAWIQPAPDTREERGPSEGREYWLAHCEGFRVDGARRRIGFVEEVRSAGAGEYLMRIRTGALGLKVIEISSREVFGIVPRAMRLWLRSPVSSEPIPLGHRRQNPHQYGRAAA